MTPKRKRIVVILGPTAGGKSTLAVAVAQHFNGQIINADSMQVYKHLNAGTAKPTAAQRAAVVHHLIDIVEPTHPFSVADWLSRTESLIAHMHPRDILPVVVGGTNLYLKTLLEGLFEGPGADQPFRASLAEFTPQQLHEQLIQVDPHAADRIHPNDRKRIVRALEVHHLTGKPISAMQQQWDQAAEPLDPLTPSYRHDPILIALRYLPQAINPLINARVRQMFAPDDGAEDLISETRRLHDAGQLADQAAQAIGARQVLEHLAGRCTAAEAMEQVKIETRRFAKAQRTWLKRYRGVHWLDADSLTQPEQTRAAIHIIDQQLAAN